jgi:HK97 family phage major capsid protein
MMGSGSGDYSHYIEPADKEALMSEEIFNEIFAAVPEKSVFMTLARRLKDMTKRAERLRILDAMASVAFVGEKGGTDTTFSAIKKTTKLAWASKYITPATIAAIIPVPEDAVDDEDYPIWTECKPSIVEGIGQLVDLATLFGTPGVDVPAAWPNGIIPGAPADHLIPLASVGDLYDDLLALNGVWNKVEEDGYEVNGVAAEINMRARLRGLRDSATGQPIFIPDPTRKMGYTLDGATFTFSRNGGWDPTQAYLIAGDWQQAVWSVRKDVTYKVLDQAVITDENYAIIHNLAQEDMIALRVTFRFGWQLPNPVNRLESDATERYPFAILTPAGSGS